jgi:signal transduction histidine kinase
MTVVAGYISMLLKDRAGVLNDQQRRLLEEAQKSCTRLSALLTEVSELATLEAGTATFNKHATDVGAALRTAIAELPPLPDDRQIAIDLQLPEQASPITGDPVKLAQSLGGVIAALRRELVASDRLVVRMRPTSNGAPGYEILLGDAAAVQALESEPIGSRTTFDEWRGGVGLSLVNARRILNAHGGSIYAPAEGGKASARILLPA